MKTKRQAREAALQALYQSDALNVWDERALQVFFDHFPEIEEAEVDASGKVFAHELVLGVIRELEAIDRAIGAASSNWTIDRMSVVDRNILRLAAYELIFDKKAPKSVIINEAIEVAKRFGSDESPVFINGVLDRLARDVDSASDGSQAPNEKA